MLAGLLLAAIVGVVVLLFRTKHRNTFILGKVPETKRFRSLVNHPEAETYPGLLILRFDGSLFFANAHDFVTAVREAIAAQDPLPHVVLLDGEAMNDIDATAVVTLKEFHIQLDQLGIQVRLAQVKTHVIEIMRRGGLLDEIPNERFYPSIQAAVDAYLAEQS